MPSRTRFLIYHRRLALLFAPLVFLQALTGSALLFRAELARMIDPVAMVRTSAPGDVPMSVLVVAAESAAPAFRVTRVFLPATSSDTAFVQLAGEDGKHSLYAALDPGTGQVLAAGSVWRFPLEAALQLHFRLMDARVGMAIVLANGLVLIFMSATGMLYWWPGSRRIVKALAIRSAAPPRARLRQWHRSIGVLVMPIMLFSAATGILLVTPELNAATPPASAAAPAARAEQIDRAVARAGSAFPGARLRDVRFPAADRIDVNFHAPRHNALAVDVVSVALSDGAIMKRLPAERNPALWMTVLPLHSGASLGIAGRLLLLAEGTILMILAVTGPLMWWHARRPKRKKS